MGEELLGVVGRVAVGIERQHVAVGRVQSSERLEFPAAEDAAHNSVITGVGVAVDPADVVGFQRLLHPLVELSPVAQIPDLDG
jgi:hypothetical protein